MDSKQKSYEKIKQLIEKGADVSAKDKNGNTPLHAAAARDNPEIVSMLIGKGSDRNAVNSEGKTPLALSQEKKLAKNIKLLSK